MTVSSDFLAYVLEQLAPLGEVSTKYMFGGAGLYSDELFFALIADDTLYLRVDDANRDEFTGRSMQPFRPYADRPQLSMSYYEVPSEVLESTLELSAWARRSVGVAMRAPPRKEKKPRLKKGRRASRRLPGAARAKR